MIEELYKDKTDSKPHKRIALTDELQQLADKQTGLEVQRNELKTSVETALTLLNPLREQMKTVVDCMKRFHEMENEYAVLSKQTYEDIHNDMQAIGAELMQTRGLLDEGTKLVNSGIEIPAMTLPNDLLPKENEVKEETAKSEQPPLVAVTIKEPTTEQSSVEDKRYRTSDKDTLSDPWKDETDEVNSMLDDILGNIPNEAAETDEKVTENETADSPEEAFYTALTDILNDEEKTSVVVDNTQNTTLIEVNIPADIAKQHPEFKYRVTDDKKLRISGEYTDNTLTVSYDVVSDVASSDGTSVAEHILTDFITMDTTDRIEKMLQERVNKASASRDYEEPALEV